MAFLDRFIDTEKTSKVEVKSPRDIYYSILKSTSGSAYTRNIDVDIFYTVYGFKGITEGVGCSTLVANVAQAIADMGLTVCVIDTSILAPVQDILLKTDVEFEDVNVYEEGKAEKRLDWFDMPYTKKSVLHISKLNQNISVLSFKGKKHTIVDFLSTNDSETLVEMALSELGTKFDIILVDICHEPSAVATACLQQSQKIIQVWNDAPTVLGNLERFLTNSATLACPLDKMSNVVFSKVQRDALGSLDNVLKEYKFKKIGVNYLSEEVALQVVVGNNLFQLPSNDKNVVAYTDCVIDVACMILNLTEDRELTKQMDADKKKKKKDGIIKTEDILNGKVDGTATKKLRDRESKIKQDLGIKPIENVNDVDKALDNNDFVDVYKDEGFITSVDEFLQDSEPAEEAQDLNIADDPDFKIMDSDGNFESNEFTDDTVEASDNIEFEPVENNDDTSSESDADATEFEPNDFKVSDDTTIEEFEPVEDIASEEEFELSDNTEIEPTSSPAEFEDDSTKPTFDPVESSDNTEEPISDGETSADMIDNEDDFSADDLDLSSLDDSEFLEETDVMDKIDIPEEFIENTEEPITEEPLDEVSTEEFDTDVKEVAFEEEESTINPEEIKDIMSNEEVSDADDFAEDFDVTGDTQELTPISEQLQASDDTEKPITEASASEDDTKDANSQEFSLETEEFTEENKEFEGITDDFEPISNSSTSEDDTEKPISTSLEDSESDTFAEDDFVLDETVENSEDASTELGSDEFFDADDDFEAAPAQNGTDDDDFILDDSDSAPTFDQSENADDTEEPILTDENDSDFDENKEAEQSSDDDNFADDDFELAEQSNENDSDDEFIDDDDFFLDDDENMKALDNYVRSQNTEF